MHTHVLSRARAHMLTRTHAHAQDLNQMTAPATLCRLSAGPDEATWCWPPTQWEQSKCWAWC